MKWIFDYLCWAPQMKFCKFVNLLKMNPWWQSFKVICVRNWMLDATSWEHGGKSVFIIKYNGSTGESYDCPSGSGLYQLTDHIYKTKSIGKQNYTVACETLSQYKDHFSRYGDFHYKDKMVIGLSYLYNGNPYTTKMASLYWDGTLVP